MLVIDKDQVHECLDFQSLIPELHKAFASDFQMPQRQVFELNTDGSSHDAFAVLPAWNNEAIAVKAFTYFPKNAEGYDSLYSKILIFDRQHGVPIAVVDGTSVTLWRTAAVSALASQLLSRSDSKVLLMCGTGNLAPYMIKAHCQVRDIEDVYCWGRSSDKISKLIEQVSISLPHVRFHEAKDLNECQQKADIISCATGSPEPLIIGDNLQPGVHLDLIGNHSKVQRECDTRSVIRSTVFVDSKTNVLNEAGELLIPIDEGVFRKSDVKAELSELCKEQVKGRESNTEITLFKSVGTALSDLATGLTVYRKCS